ncbi:homeobox-domain-containing protein, partial [Hesseltinella vesiculosa]
RKRTRATPEQLAVLEKTFSVNPSPNNRVREQLSRELGMSERSIQIWFQNRRAKVKNMAKRSATAASKLPWSNQTPPASLHTAASPLAHQRIHQPSEHPACPHTSLQIGTWKRMSLRPHDLECFFDRQLRCMVWRIQDGQQRFKMHIGLDVIEKMQLDPLMERMGWARLSVTVTQPEGISFYMEDLHGQGSDNWTQCRDFTQDRQATSVTLHAVDGPAMAL